MTSAHRITVGEEIRTSADLAGLRGGGVRLAGPNAWTGAQDFTGATVTGIAGGGGAASLLDRGNWAITTIYAVGDVVTQSGQRYACRTAHTAGTFATDLTASKWVALDAVAAITVTEIVNTVAASGAAVTIPAVTTATVNHVTLTANCTLTFPTVTAGQSFTLVLKQDATGSRTVTWPGSVVWAGGIAPTLSATGNKRDTFSFASPDGANWFGYVTGQAF